MESYLQTNPKPKKRPTWVQAIALCLAVAAIAVAVTGVVLNRRYEKKLAESDVSRYSKLEEIRALLDAYYVGQYTDEDVMEMLSAAYMYGINDKWAYYTAAADMQELYEDKTGTYAGIGVTVTLDADTGMLIVSDVTPGSPAEEAGICRLDKLYAVEGELVSALGQDATVSKVRGEVGTFVNLTILRNGLYQEMRVERRIVESNSVTSELIDGHVGLIRISQFTTVAATQFEQKLAHLLEIGADSLIIDVRNNPGGSLNTLISILDLLMPKGEVFIERDKAGNENRISVDDKYCNLPLIMLTNEYSYSAAEYLAAVTQEQGRSYVIGKPTTGKGEGQQTFNLSDGSAVSFSVIKYFTPNGVSIGEMGGITPDMVVDMTYEQEAKIGSVDYSEDPQIVAALAYMAEVLLK